ncbi:hypothetical protein Tco_1293444 [Tanacetum coccineum]
MKIEVVLIKEKFKAVRDRQRSYAGNRRKPYKLKKGSDWYVPFVHNAVDNGNDWRIVYAGQRNVTIELLCGYIFVMVILRMRTTSVDIPAGISMGLFMIVNCRPTSRKLLGISNGLAKVQFWYTVKKVKGTNSYEFLLANKKCSVDAKVFWKILDICPRVQGVDFTKVLDDETTLTFLIELGYKGSLYKHLSMHVDHMHQLWRTLVVIINKCLSRKAAIKMTRHRKNRLTSSRVNEYRLPIPETMLTEGIKQSESYQMFIKYSTGLLPPKKSRGKGSQGKKTTDTPEADVDVSKESNSEPARK